jgi:hypothetical protein
MSEAPVSPPATEIEPPEPSGSRREPAHSRRRTKAELGSMQALATAGIVGIATALGAVLVGNDVAGWVVGLVIGLLSVILATLLHSSRQLAP